MKKIFYPPNSLIAIDSQWAGTIKKSNSAKVNRKYSRVFDLLVRSPQLHSVQLTTRCGHRLMATILSCVNHLFA